MVKNPLNRIEENIEICCFERIKNSVENFQLSLLVHLMIPLQHSVISIFNLFGNLKKFGNAAYWSTFENSNLSSLS